MDGIMQDHRVYMESRDTYKRTAEYFQKECENVLEPMKKERDILLRENKKLKEHIIFLEKENDNLNTILTDINYIRELD